MSLRQARIPSLAVLRAVALALAFAAVLIGPAEAKPLVLPGPGKHLLALVGTDGRILDRSLFTVR